MKSLFYLSIILVLSPSLLFCSRNSKNSSPKKGFPVGQWSWEKNKGNLRQKVITREIWNIEVVKGKYKVSLIHFKLGRSNSAFPCSGSSSYTTHAKYIFPVKSVSLGFITLGKPKIEHVPSPCDEELPPRSKIILQRLIGGRVAVIEDKKSYFIHPWTLNGVWSWKRVTPAKNRIDKKVEIEEWSLKQSPDGSITGFYDRIVIRKSSSGRKYQCNGKKEIWFFSRYKVKGKIVENGRIKLKETGYILPQNENCEPSGKRHLDSFTGILIGDTIQFKSKVEQIEQTLKRKYGFKSSKKSE